MIVWRCQYKWEFCAGFDIILAASNLEIVRLASGLLRAIAYLPIDRTVSFAENAEATPTARWE